MTKTLTLIFCRILCPLWEITFKAVCFKKQKYKIQSPKIRRNIVGICTQNIDKTGDI